MIDRIIGTLGIYMAGIVAGLMTIDLVKDYRELRLEKQKIPQT